MNAYSSLLQQKLDKLIAIVHICFMSDTSKFTASITSLIKVPPEAESCRHIGAVAKRYERAAQDVRMEAVDSLGRQFNSLAFFVLIH